MWGRALRFSIRNAEDGQLRLAVFFGVRTIVGRFSMRRMAMLKRVFPGVVLMLVLGAVCPQTIAAQTAGAQTAKATATLKGDAAHPAHGQHWVDTRLYFGLGPAEAPEKGVSEAAWREFLDKEVTPRFPAGLSVMEVYGQWQGKGSTSPERI